MNFAVALEADGTIAVQLQLVLPVIALGERCGRELAAWV